MCSGLRGLSGLQAAGMPAPSLHRLRSLSHMLVCPNPGAGSALSFSALGGAWLLGKEGPWGSSARGAVSHAQSSVLQPRGQPAQRSWYLAVYLVSCHCVAAFKRAAWGPWVVLQVQPGHGMSWSGRRQARKPSYECQALWTLSSAASKAYGAAGAPQGSRLLTNPA